MLKQLSSEAGVHKVSNLFRNDDLESLQSKKPELMQPKFKMNL